MKRFLLLLFLLIPAFVLAEVTLEEAKTNGMQETLRGYIASSENMVDICIYEQEWVNPTKEFTKGRMIKRAVITAVHKGNFAVGTRLQYCHYIEEPPKLFTNFRSTVEGELRTFFFDRADGRETDGRFVIEGDGHWGFSRTSGVFRELFQLEQQARAPKK